MWFLLLASLCLPVYGHVTCSTLPRPDFCIVSATPPPPFPCSFRFRKVIEIIETSYLDALFGSRYEIWLRLRFRFSADQRGTIKTEPFRASLATTLSTKQSRPVVPYDGNNSRVTGIKMIHCINNSQ